MKNKGRILIKNEKIVQSVEELKKHLQEQLRFLKKSCRDYDNGDISEAKRIALQLRVLLHDTNSSNSLLSQLNLKEKLSYLDSAFPFDPHNLMPHCGLLFINSNSTIYIPLLNDGPPIPKKFIAFEPWWKNSIVIKDRMGKEFSRKDLILNITNTDGGAHIDRKLNKSYADLSRNNSVGIQLVIKKPDQEKEIFDMQCVELASVRQIAYELIASLDNFTTT